MMLVRRMTAFLLVGSLCLPAAVFAMTSTQYQINWDSVNSGGEDTSSSTNFQLRDTLGEAGTGLSQSESYQISAGYRAGDTQDPSLSLTIGTQENQTSVPWSAFSNAGKQVTVDSAANFSTGDYIGVVENVGASQLVAYGKVASISGSDITVDAWDGEPGSISASPNGGNDLVYRLDGSSAALGTSLVGSVATSLTITDVVSNAQNGYTVSVQADGGLRNADGLTVADVADGVVSAGSEEYGGKAVGAYATSTGSDFSIPTASTRDIQDSTSFGNYDRVGVIYKFSAAASTASGNYAQLIYYRLTGNF